MLLFGAKHCIRELVNPGPAEPVYALPLQTLQVQINSEEAH